MLSTLTAEDAGRARATIEAALTEPVLVATAPAQQEAWATVQGDLSPEDAGKVYAALDAASPPVLPAPPATVSTLPTAATVPTVALDANGLPWDARLHAGTKTKNADGTWRALRKPAAPKADVEADLLAGLAARPTAVPPPPGTETFAQYMARIGTMFATNPEKAMAAMSAALAPCGLTHVGQLAGRADLIPEVDARFQAGAPS